MNILKKYKDSYLSYFLMYAFYFLSWSLFSTLISVYLMGMGFTASQVALVVSVSFGASLVVQPFIGVLNDLLSPKKINLVLFAFITIGGLLFINAKSLITITILYSFVLMLINGTMTMLERIATEAPYQYGKIRIWGTIGYAAGSALAGLLYQYIAPKAIFITFIFTMLLCMLGVAGTQDHKIVSTKEKATTSDFISIFKNKQFLIYLVIYSLFFGLWNLSNTYIPSMFQNDGMKISTVSTWLSIAVLCECPLVFFSHLFMDKISNKTLLIIIYVVAILQYIIYGFNMPVPIKMAITFIAKHPGSMLFVMANIKIVNTIVDEHVQMTALAIAQTVRNLTSIVFQYIGGMILEHTSYPQMFQCCLVVITIGFIITLLYKLPKGKGQQLFH